MIRIDFDNNLISGTFDDEPIDGIDALIAGLQKIRDKLVSGVVEAELSSVTWREGHVYFERVSKHWGDSYKITGIII